MYSELRLDVLDVYDEYKAKMEDIFGPRHNPHELPGFREKPFTFRDSNGEQFP